MRVECEVVAVDLRQRVDLKMLIVLLINDNDEMNKKDMTENIYSKSLYM